MFPDPIIAVVNCFEQFMNHVRCLDDQLRYFTGVISFVMASFTR